MALVPAWFKRRQNNDERACDDWSLAARAARSNPALTELYSRHADRTYRMAYGLLGDTQAAEDATQESFLRLTRAAPRHQNAAFTTWFSAIVLNVCRELRRQRPPLVSSLEETPVTAADAAERGRSLAELIRALAELPARQREVVVLRYLEGFTAPETAALLDCEVGTVKTHLHRATQKLRCQL
ncbi:MAG: RNA polymerase sigma factor [Pseudomonadota bacterium]